MILKILLKSLHIMFSIFLIWQSILLVNRLTTNQFTRLTDILLNAIFINIFVTGIFTIVYSFPIYKLLPSKYYKINKTKRLKAFCKIIQIDLFKKILVHTLWRKRHNKKYYFNGTINGLRDFEINSMKAEFGHFIGFTIVMVITIYIGIKGSLQSAIMIFIINILFNFYPFILQRYHRSRIELLRQSV